MNLDQLTEHQKKVVCRLPYRAGLYVSQCDQSGGEDSDEEELRALHNLIHGFAANVFGSELIQYVMEETLKHKDSWFEWDKSLDMVLSECSDSISILRSYADEKEVNAYAMRIMEIGEAVALAFREDSYGDGFFGHMEARVKYWLACNKARAAKAPIRSFHDFLAISPQEREALQKLARALGTFYV